MYINKLGQNYADALKEALELKRNGTIPAAIDDELGHILYSISQWSIATYVTGGKLWRTWSQDPDFQADILCSIVAYSNKVNLERRPKEILTYLYKIGRSAIRDKIMAANALKRQHEEQSLNGIIEESDFYGERTGVKYEIDTEFN